MENKEESKNEKKGLAGRLVLTLLLILVLVGSVVAITYAAFTWSASGASRSTNTISTGTMSCVINEGNPISINSAHPISDEVGKALVNDPDPIAGYSTAYTDVTVSCTCSDSVCNGNYSVYLENTSTSPAVPEEDIKLYITDGEVSETELAPLALYNSYTNATLDGGQSVKEIYENSFTSTFSEKVRVRLWLADTYEVNATPSNFSVKVHAKVETN